jgi:hypothetical protein
MNKQFISRLFQQGLFKKVVERVVNQHGEIPIARKLISFKEK